MTTQTRTDVTSASKLLAGALYRRGDLGGRMTSLRYTEMKGVQAVFAFSDTQ